MNMTILPKDEQVIVPKRPFPATTIEEVAGFLAYDGASKTVEEMETAVQKGIVETEHLDNPSDTKKN